MTQDLARQAGAAYRERSDLRNLTIDLGGPIADQLERRKLSGAEALAVVASLSTSLLATVASVLEDEETPFITTALAFGRLVQAALPRFADSVHPDVLFAQLAPLVLSPDALIDRDARQKRVADWCAAAFGAGHASSVPQRGIRLAEEAIEAAQAAGCERAMVHRLVDHVFDRPAGELGQELGGVGVTLLALAAAAGLSADDCEQSEIERVLAKPLAHFAARNAAKNAAGFNVASGEEAHG